MSLISHLSDPRFAEFYRYWDGKRVGAGRLIARRADIDPTEIPRLLPHLLITERVSQRFRFRLIGTEIVRRFGEDHTGRFLDELFTGDYRAFLLRTYRLVVDKRQGVYAETRYRFDPHYSIRIKRLLLPLACDGSDDVRQVMAMILFANDGPQDEVIAIDGVAGRADHRLELASG